MNIFSRRWFILVMVLASGAIAMGFLVYHIWIGIPERAIGSLSAFLVAAAIFVLHRFSRTHVPALTVAVLYAVGVTLWLLASESFPQSDALWSFLVPPIVAYAGGVVLARMLLPLYFGVVALLTLHPALPFQRLHHDTDFTVRFLAMLAIVSMTSYAFEAMRSRAQARLTDEIRERSAAEANLEQANARLQVAAGQAELLAGEAEAANEAKSSFLWQMSHDIRTPLTSILGTAELLELTDLDPRQRRYVQTIRRNGLALTDLIGDILDLARIESGRVDVFVEPCDVRRVVDYVLDVMAPQAAQKDLTLVAEVATDLPTNVVSDSGSLRRILLNLLGNAIKFTEAGHIVLSITTGPDGDPYRWRMAVADTGPGIPADARSRIFESFTQEALPNGGRRAGSGLGLAICSRLVEVLGGTIRLESEVGVGSTFIVDLPLVEAPEQDQARNGTDAPPAPAGLNLLVVDDSHAARRVVAELLSEAGHVVEEAASASQALERLAHWPCDAVFMDVQMPDMDGIEAVRRLREGQGKTLRPEIPVVAVTALADPGTAARCLDAGMDVVVVKPVSRTILESALATALARHQPSLASFDGSGAFTSTEAPRTSRPDRA